MNEDNESTARRHDSLSEPDKRPKELPSDSSVGTPVPLHVALNFGINAETLSSDGLGNGLPESQGSQNQVETKHRLISEIGRYKVEKILGEGGFGIVYLARDEELKRKVAIKVPRQDAIFTLEDIEAYLVEAQILACLDHPNIVPIFDIGRTENGLPFIVSKFIEGRSLSERTRDVPLGIRETIELVIRVADALQYAHDHRLVHRDVKPVNILLEDDKKPYLVDFGLAMREEDYGKGHGYSGTPAYMSPEQSNGEGHLVDGRSDIFSLGVILYEQLTGQHPRMKSAVLNFLGTVSDIEPKAPRQINHAIPVELERITLKAIARRVSDRYSSGRELADDLSCWLKIADGQGQGDEPTPTRIVPKGLRSFEAEDTDFFPGLLPGPRGRDGLPETLRFWKSRIEEKNADKTFSVGLIYGPSGCGKSSLVKAGLLPRLAPTVITIYLEATGADTESRLLNAVRRQFKSIPESADLKEALATLRRGLGVPAGKKVLIVLDQFEQWLHSSQNDVEDKLATALRQSDGGRLQCLIMVRDDFWLAITRFMRALDVRLMEGQNSSLVDLFDSEHAFKVLAACGQAFGKLPTIENASSDQQAFLEQAILGLTVDRKLIPVRLALFAEMMKDKLWNPASLHEVGGTEGVGVTFLEETFHSPNSPLENRYHQSAARKVLVALLPEAGADIKGHMRSHAELLEASGYLNRPGDFDDLLQILDGRLRLITPTDAEGIDRTQSESSPISSKHYQLTHDYLVPSLREWLTQKQKETRSGRAELLLADLASIWNARQENRQLPSLAQWILIRSSTSRSKWTKPQRKMMGHAGAYHSIRATCLMLFLVISFDFVISNREKMKTETDQMESASRTARILDSSPAKIESLIEEIGPFRTWANESFRKEIINPFNRSRKLNASLALLPVDESQVPFLRASLLDSLPEETMVIARALKPHRTPLIEDLWRVVLNSPPQNRSQRFRAAAALAIFDENNTKWEQAGRIVADEIVLENPIYLGEWTVAFRHLKKYLIPRLQEIFQEIDPDRKAERILATNILADYVGDDPDFLVSLLIDSDDKQFDVIYKKLKSHAGIVRLLKEVIKSTPDPKKQDDVERVAKHRVNAAIGLIREGQAPPIWPLLKQSTDNRFRSYFIHRFAPMGGQPELLIEQLDIERDASIRQVLILSLGEYRGNQGSVEVVKKHLPKFRKIYESAEDGGEHSAAEWLLRQFNDHEWIAKTDETWRQDKNRRRQLEEQVKATAKETTPTFSSRWLMNGQGQKELIISGPRIVSMGSPESEQGREAEEPTVHLRRIDRTFAILAKPVTVDQYMREFKETHKADKEIFLRNKELPVGAIDWYDAAKYCNFLSKKEGYSEDQWCYEVKDGQVWPKKNYLSLKGYRLPMESEIECAIRAGTTTSRFFGESAELLPKYAWYQLNADERTWPVGKLKPNDFGLFDANGNVFTWCTDKFKKFVPPTDGKPLPDVEEESSPSDSPRVMKGGSFFFAASDMRSASSYHYNPTVKFNSFGLRPVRTIPMK